MFEALNEKFESLFAKIKGSGKITEKNIDDISREIRMILLEADVNFKIAKGFVQDIKEKAIGRDVIKSITPGQLFIKIVHDSLVELMGTETKEPLLAGSNPFVIMVAGLQGTGKTTLCGKLALYYRKKGRKPYMAACDVYRPAAIDQLETVGKSIDVGVYRGQGTDAVKIAKEAVSEASKKGLDLVIVDTAGRLHVDEMMMAEVKKIRDAVKPSLILYTVDSLTGQDAVNSASAFHEVLDFHGMVLTKADADSKGGAILSAVKTTGKPVYFISTGEKMNDLSLFHPDRMTQRILGMGDIVSLVETAQENVSETEAQKLADKLRQNKFDLEDFLKQIALLKKMGPFENLLKMIPGVGSQLKNINFDPSIITRIEAIVFSMTPKERRNPDILKASRKIRVAKGSGTTVEDVNRLLKQFEDMRKMMKQMNKMQNKGKGFQMPNIPNMKQGAGSMNFPRV